jgi:hypothetical protein
MVRMTLWSYTMLTDVAVGCGDSASRMVEAVSRAFPPFSQRATMKRRGD